MCIVIFSGSRNFVSSHNSFDSDDEDSDDTSEHLDHDYDFSIGRGGKKVVNKGRWTKEEVRIPKNFICGEVNCEFHLLDVGMLFSLLP